MTGTRLDWYVGEVESCSNLAAIERTLFFFVGRFIALVLSAEFRSAGSVIMEVCGGGWWRVVKWKGLL